VGEVTKWAPAASLTTTAEENTLQWTAIGASWWDCAFWYPH